eukprot:6194009-Pleurochrysis_carterae.AAC.2
MHIFCWLRVGERCANRALAWQSARYRAGDRSAYDRMRVDYCFLLRRAWVPLLLQLVQMHYMREGTLVGSAEFRFAAALGCCAPES